METISVIVPTYNRQQYLPKLVSCFVAQTCQHKELLIGDDSQQPCEWLVQLARETDNIHYFHFPQRMTIGAKRNWLAKQATGDLIAQFDDDDDYAPGYLAFMSHQLKQSGYDFLTLSRWFCYATALKLFCYWETDRVSSSHYRVASDGVTSIQLDVTNLTAMETFIQNNLWGYGFSYVYRKAVLETVQFPDQNFGEDFAFYTQLKAMDFNTGCVADEEGLVLHMMHAANTSVIFPQYILPHGLRHRFFPQATL
jgi:glycosyltransferase involved in cell wall biosynthesis